MLFRSGGADTFVCVLSDANTSDVDLIADFTNGTDLIGLEDRTFSDLTITGVAMGGSNHTLISDTASSKNLFFLQSVDASLIDGSDFVVTDFV